MLSSVARTRRADLAHGCHLALSIVGTCQRKPFARRASRTVHVCSCPSDDSAAQWDDDAEDIINTAWNRWKQCADWADADLVHRNYACSAESYLHITNILRTYGNAPCHFDEEGLVELLAYVSDGSTAVKPSARAKVQQLLSLIALDAIEKTEMRPIDAARLAIAANADPIRFAARLAELGELLSGVNLVELVARCPDLLLLPDMHWHEIEKRMTNYQLLVPEVPVDEVQAFMASDPYIHLLGDLESKFEGSGWETPNGLSRTGAFGYALGKARAWLEKRDKVDKVDSTTAFQWLRDNHGFFALCADGWKHMGSGRGDLN